MLRQMVARNELTILMITHKFREVIAFAEEVTILRRGRVAGEGRVSTLTSDAMAGMMIGAQELTKAPARSGEFGAVRLEIKHLAAIDDAGQPALHEVSLAIRAGEIVGIAGVSGNGQRQLVEVLAGQREASGGEILIAGASYHATREEMRRHKLSCLREPQRSACAGRGATESGAGFRPAAFAAGKAGFVRQSSAALGWTQARSRTAQPDSLGRRSSGGNGAAVRAREPGGSDVMIAPIPALGRFRGGCRFTREIVAMRNHGAAALLVSETFDEPALADRIRGFRPLRVRRARASRSAPRSRRMAGTLTPLLLF
jgi:simple sugar transport system ATP-binding protein